VKVGSGAFPGFRKILVNGSFFNNPSFADTNRLRNLMEEQVGMPRAP